MNWGQLPLVPSLWSLSWSYVPGQDWPPFMPGLGPADRSTMQVETTSHSLCWAWGCLVRATRHTKVICCLFAVSGPLRGLGEMCSMSWGTLSICLCTGAYSEWVCERVGLYVVPLKEPPQSLVGLCLGHSPLWIFQPDVMGTPVFSTDAPGCRAWCGAHHSQGNPFWFLFATPWMWDLPVLPFLPVLMWILMWLWEEASTVFF